MYEWIAAKVADWLYELLVKHIEHKWKHRHKESTWLHLARRVSKRYEDHHDYHI